MFFAPFLALYALIFLVVIALLFAFLEIGVIHYAFGALGLPPELAFLALLASLAGSYINIPVAQIDRRRTARRRGRELLRRAVSSAGQICRCDDHTWPSTWAGQWCRC